MRKSLWILLVWSLTGCYVYAPVGTAAPETGRDVRLHLSPAQDLDVGTVIVRDVTQVEGVLYRADSDTLAVWSTWLRSRVGPRYHADGQIFVWDRQTVPRLEVRTIHPARTIAASALALAAGAAIFAFTADLGAGGSGEPGGNGTETRIVATIPVIGIPRIP